MSTPEPDLKHQVMSCSPSMMLLLHPMAKGRVDARDGTPQEQMMFSVHGSARLEQVGAVKCISGRASAC